MKTYHIIDNGSIPFIVKVDKDIATILRQEKHGEPYAELTTMKFDKIYIGNDPKNFTKSMGENWDKIYQGNSILLKLNESKYVLIGWKIYSFQLEEDDQVKKYISPIGPNFVPYPYLIGKKNTYFMLEEQYVSNDLLDLNKEAYYQMYSDIKKSDKKYMSHVKVIQERLY